MSQNGLNILALVDSKPGHVNQVIGLVEAIQRKTKASVKTINVSIGLIGFLREVRNCEERPQLVIAAGHRTHKYVLIMRFIFGAYTVVLMKPTLLPFAFNLRFIPKHDNVSESSNTIVTEGAINRIRPSDNLDPSQGLVLLGGISSHFDWSSEALTVQLKELFDRYPEVDWQIANSRRTPADMETVLTANHIKQPFVKFNEVGSEWMLGQLSQTGHIWVTEDSVSMVFEAMTAGARVGVLRLSNSKPNRVSREIGRLLAEDKVMELKTLGAESSRLNTQGVVPLDEATRCADIVVKRMIEKGYV